MIYRLTLGLVLDGPAPHGLGDRLAELRGVTSVEATSDRVTLTLTEEAAIPAAALASAAERTLEAMSLADGRCGEIVSAEVFTEAEADRRAAEDGLPEVVGIAEIADLLHISRQRAGALQAREGFPQPVASCALDLCGGSVISRRSRGRGTGSPADQPRPLPPFPRRSMSVSWFGP